GLADDAFLPGRHYTVTSYLTKRVTWATSNIYWDGSKLTFDADATHGGVAGGIPSVTTVNSPRYQGLLFKWGSLDGISPAGSVYLNLFSYVYVPSTTTAGYNASYSKVRPTTSVWTAIPYIPETLVPADGSVLPRKAILDSGTWYGDICAYITHGVWRMPTKQEYNPGNQTDNIVLVDTEPTGEGWWISNENTWSSVTPDNDEISSSGKFELDPDNMFMLKTKWGQRVALPPVQQTTLGGLGGGFIILPDPGIAGDYWTGSSSLLNDQAAFIRLRAAGDPNGTNFSVDAGRDVACPVRCVK
ncbi:MAG: hypothetical protein LBN29_08295, partial [Mediterranea sp.]|nr:hypothetical protein [Mediterranea sp.]